MRLLACEMHSGVRVQKRQVNVCVPLLMLALELKLQLENGRKAVLGEQAIALNSGRLQAAVVSREESPYFGKVLWRASGRKFWKFKCFALKSILKKARRALVFGVIDHHLEEDAGSKVVLDYFVVVQAGVYVLEKARGCEALGCSICRWRELASQRLYKKLVCVSCSTLWYRLAPTVSTNSDTRSSA